MSPVKEGAMLCTSRNLSILRDMVLVVSFCHTRDQMVDICRPAEDRLPSDAPSMPFSVGA